MSERSPKEIVSGRVIAVVWSAFLAFSMVYNFLPEKTLQARSAMAWLWFMPLLTLVPILNVLYAMSFKAYMRALLTVGAGYFGQWLFIMATIDGGWARVFAPHLVEDVTGPRFPFYEIGYYGVGFQILGILMMAISTYKIRQLRRHETHESLVVNYKEI